MTTLGGVMSAKLPDFARDLDDIQSFRRQLRESRHREECVTALRAQEQALKEYERLSRELEPELEEKQALLEKGKVESKHLVTELFDAQEDIKRKRAEVRLKYESELQIKASAEGLAKRRKVLQEKEEKIEQVRSSLGFQYHFTNIAVAKAANGCITGSIRESQECEPKLFEIQSEPETVEVASQLWNLVRS